MLQKNNYALKQNENKSNVLRKGSTMNRDNHTSFVLFTELGKKKEGGGGLYDPSW